MCGSVRSRTEINLPASAIPATNVPDCGGYILERVQVMRVDRVDGRVIVEFSNGVVAAYTAEFLFEHHDKGGEVVGFEPPADFGG